MSIFQQLLIAYEFGRSVVITLKGLGLIRGVISNFKYDLNAEIGTFDLTSCEGNHQGRFEVKQVERCYTAFYPQFVIKDFSDLVQRIDNYDLLIYWEHYKQQNLSLEFFYNNATRECRFHEQTKVARTVDGWKILLYQHAKKYENGKVEFEDGFRWFFIAQMEDLELEYTGELPVWE